MPALNVVVYFMLSSDQFIDEMVLKVVRMTIQVTIMQDPNEKHFDCVDVLSKYEVNDNNNLFCSALSRIVAFHRHSLLTIITAS